MAILAPDRSYFPGLPKYLSFVDDPGTPATQWTH